MPNNSNTNLKMKMVTPTPSLPPQEAVSQYEETNFLNRGEGGRVGGLPGSGLSKDYEPLPKDFDLPAPSRSGEGRAATFIRSELSVPST